ncbi:MAG: hypothetical protein GXO21_08115 [Aquificae bacterium]|nr:hypothetical protein [Aquificota bacterium]
MVIALLKGNKPVSYISETAICDICGSKGKLVDGEKLKKDLKFEIENPVGFYECSNPKCDVAYFNKELKIYFLKQDISSK